jgi:hypothetical protein
MSRAIGVCLMATFLAITAGCTMCAHPYDYCGPVYAGQNCEPCNPQARAGSILSPPLPVPGAQGETQQTAAGPTDPSLPPAGRSGQRNRQGVVRTSAEMDLQPTPAPPGQIPADGARGGARPLVEDPSLRGRGVAPNQPYSDGGPMASDPMYGGSCGPECSGCPGNCDECGCGPVFQRPCGLGGLLHDRMWVRADALLWWTKGGNIPPLLTTSSDGTSQAQAGVLGQPGTSVLLGNQELNSAFRSGGRIAFGTWLDPCNTCGIEFSYLALDQDVEQFNANSTGTPILARPFFNVETGAEDSLVLAFPGTQQGNFSTSSTTNFQSADVLMRRAISRGPSSRIELLAGYRYQRLTDGLDINDTFSGTGSTFNLFDGFHTQNDFNGGEVGFATKSHWYRLSLETKVKVGLGNTHSRVAIDGSTTVTTGNQSNTFAGGMLALPSNMGNHESDQFSMVPELGATLGYDLTRHIRATVGYTFLYWSNVARPGDQIDLNINPAQFPPGTAGATKPAFALHTSDFWAQGINLGLDCRF